VGGWVVGGCLGKKVSLRTTSLRDVVKNTKLVRVFCQSLIMFGHVLISITISLLLFLINTSEAADEKNVQNLVYHKFAIDFDNNFSNIQSKPKEEMKQYLEQFTNRINKLQHIWSVLKQSEIENKHHSSKVYYWLE
jgi:hypothetical protein